MPNFYTKVNLLKWLLINEIDFTKVLLFVNNKKIADDLEKELQDKEYEYGFYTDIESDTFPKGLNEDIIRAISKRRTNLSG